MKRISSLIFSTLLVLMFSCNNDKDEIKKSPVTTSGKVALADGHYWEQLPGAAVDIGVGDINSVYVIARDDNGSNGASIFKLEGGNWTQIEGLARRVSVNASGLVYVVNGYGEVYYKNPRYSEHFYRIGGISATDIGAAGYIYTVGTDNMWSGNYGVHFWQGGNSWMDIPNSAALKIAVDANSNPWFVDAQGYIYRGVGYPQSDDFYWEYVSGPGSGAVSAIDIGTGSDGSVFILGADDGIEGGFVYKWNDANKDWNRIDGVRGVAIAADNEGKPWVVQRSGAIFRYR